MDLKLFLLISIVLNHHWMKTFAISVPCDDDFTVDSYAITYFVTKTSNQKLEANVLDFMSHSDYYWLQKFPEKREPDPLPGNLTGVDAAFFIETIDCSKNGTNLIAIKDNIFNTLSLETNEWKINQSLSGHHFFRRILAPISDNMKIEAITDWKPNRIIVFRDQTYQVIEWQNICDALNGTGIEVYPKVTTKDWFPNNSLIYSAQMIVPPNEGQNQSLYLFSEKHSREMVVRDLNKTNGQIIGQLEPLKQIKQVFICLEENPKDIRLNITLIPEPVVGPTELQNIERTETTKNESTSPLPAIICAIILLSVVLLIISIVLPKEKYIFAQKDNQI